MPRLKSAELRKMNDKELQAKLSELRSELVKLKSAASRGVLRKETGEIRILKKNIARVLTVKSTLKSRGAE